MRNGKQSVFRDERRRYEPVNRQAAGVFKRATWEQMPPPEPKFIPGPEEGAQATIKAAQERLAQIKIEQTAHREEVKRRDERNKRWHENRERLATCFQHAKHTLRAIHKRKGLPKPTVQAVHAFARTLPMHGQKI